MAHTLISGDKYLGANYLSTQYGYSLKQSKEFKCSGKYNYSSPLAM